MLKYKAPFEFLMAVLLESSLISESQSNDLSNFNLILFDKLKDQHGKVIDCTLPLLFELKDVATCTKTNICRFNFENIFHNNSESLYKKYWGESPDSFSEIPFLTKKASDDRDTFLLFLRDVLWDFIFSKVSNVIMLTNIYHSKSQTRKLCTLNEDLFVLNSMRDKIVLKFPYFEKNIKNDDLFFYLSQKSIYLALNRPDYVSHPHYTHVNHTTLNFIEVIGRVIRFESWLLRSKIKQEDIFLQTNTNNNIEKDFANWVKTILF